MEVLGILLVSWFFYNGGPELKYEYKDLQGNRSQKERVADFEYCTLFAKGSKSELQQQSDCMGRRGYELVAVEKKEGE